MKKSSFIFFLFFAHFFYSQHHKIRDSILNQGLTLYRTEKASWVATDLLLRDFPELKSQVRGYVSYIDSNNVITVFHGKKPDNILLKFIFDSLPSPEKYAVKTRETATNFEKKLIRMRQYALEILSNDTENFFDFYQNTSFNLIPIISKNERKVYILTGPKTPGFVLFGNDYLLTFSENNELVSKEKLHNTLIALPVGSDEDNTVLKMTMHSHVKTPYITETDICTMLLYKNFVQWKTHTVISEKFASIFDLENETLQIIPIEAWEKSQGIEKD